MTTTLVTRCGGLRFIISATTLPDTSTPVYLCSAHVAGNRPARMITKFENGTRNSAPWPIRLNVRTADGLGDLLRAVVGDVECFEVTK